MVAQSQSADGAIPTMAALSLLDDFILSQDWCVCRPTSVEAAMAAPSECSNYFAVDKVSGGDQLHCHAITAFIEAAKNVFTKNAHQESHWKEFTLETEMNISRSVFGYRESELESHVREFLLSPGVLSQITTRMSLLPSCDSTSFEAFLQPECPIRLHQGSGRPASVDYAINLQVSNQLLKCIPVEAKRAFSIPSIKQLSLSASETV